MADVDEPVAASPAPTFEQDRLSLEGVRVCLIFEHSLSHYSRLLQEIAGLQEAGATVELLTSFSDDEALPEGVGRTVAPLSAVEEFPFSRLRWRPVRGIDNRIRRLLRPRIMRYRETHDTLVREKALRELVRRVDILWVIDEMSLPTAMAAAKRAGTKVVYETVDLVPEYPYWGEEKRRERLEEERRLIGRVDGFITACESYADYYMERYGDKELHRRPVVRDNMPSVIVESITPTRSPLQLLFLGSLMFDRPVLELIDAMTGAAPGVTLTFQGKNYLGDEPTRLIEERGLADRVRILEPCGPDEIVETAHRYDVGIVALRGDNENERRASTSKLFTFMAAGLAVLGSDLPGIARVVNEYGNGVLVDGMESADWAKAIDEIAMMPLESIDAMKRRSVDAARLHAWERQKTEFVGEFVRALGRMG